MARKISEGKSVKVTVPAGNSVEAGNFVKIGGFIGMALKSGAGGEQITLDVTPGLYETSQIKTTETYNTGTKIYWDNTNNVFTTSSASGANPFVGIVVEPKDSNGVIVFYFNPFVAMI